MTSPGPMPAGGGGDLSSPPPHVLAHPLLRSSSSAADRTPPPPPPPLLPPGPMAFVPPPHAWFPNIFGDSARNGMMLPSPVATWFDGGGAPRAGSAPPPPGPKMVTAAAVMSPVSPTSVAAAAAGVAEGVDEAVDVWKRHQPHICCVCLDDRAVVVDAPLWVCANPACDVAVHRECASIVPGQIPPRMAESTHAPPGWRCDRCQSLESAHVVCTYCPLRIGAFTRLPGGPRGRGPWAHVVCARWHYRASASPVSGQAATKSPALLRAGSMRVGATVGTSSSGASGSSASGAASSGTVEVGSRSTARCCYCPRPAEALYGALLKCADRTCTHHFHAACAHSEGLLPVAVTTDEFGGARCREHAYNALAWPVAYAASNAWVQWARLRHQLEALVPTSADLVAASGLSVLPAASFLFWPSDDEDEDEEEHGNHHHQQQHLHQRHQHGPGCSHHHLHHDHPALHHGAAPLQLPLAFDVDDQSAFLPSASLSLSSLHLLASPDLLPLGRLASYPPTTTSTSESASVAGTRPASPTLTDIETQVIHVFRTLQASERSSRVIDQLGLELAVQLSEWVDARTAASGRASPPRESCPRDPVWLLDQLTPLLHRRRAVPRLVCGVPATPPVDRKRPAPDSTPLMRASKRISPTPADGEMVMMGDAYALAAETDPTSAEAAHAAAAATAAAAAAAAAAIMEFVPITSPLFLNHAQVVADLDALAARHEGYEPKPAPTAGSKGGVKRKSNNSNAASAAGDASPPTDSSSSSSSSATPAARPAGLTYQELRFPNDLYTPNWTRGIGHGKEGLCRLCPPESGEAWFKIKVSAYWYHLNYHHGVSQTSGRPFDAPVQERFDSQARIREGLCHKCRAWIPLDSPRHTPVNVPQIYWWKHAQKCHFRDPRGSGSGNRNGGGEARAALMPAVGGGVASSAPATRRRTAAATSARAAPTPTGAIAAAPANEVQSRSQPPVAASALFGAGGRTARRRPRFDDDEDDDDDDEGDDDDEYVD